MNHAVGGLVNSTNVLSVTGILLGVLAVVVLLAVIGVFVIVVVANRADPDPRGHRPAAVYMFGLSFVTLWTAVIGAVLAVTSVVHLLGTYRASGPGLHPVGDAVARNVVFSLLLVAVSLTVLIVHLRKGLEYARNDNDSPGPSARVAQTYIAAVGFISVLVLVISVVIVIYTIFQLIAPGVFAAGGGRTVTARRLIDAGFVMVVQILILLTHRHLVWPGLRVFDVWKKRQQEEPDISARPL